MADIIAAAHLAGEKRIEEGLAEFSHGPLTGAGRRTSLMVGIEQRGAQIRQDTGERPIIGREAHDAARLACR
ncbi:hypothetical protein [Candidatus Amarolinea dominans]|uniref:hypothetical protein n=1 Tax=Candidatus Amarolinea dominans TaxID=3140696 RepID=UPI001D7D156F|nr:hypothetical protein [Anaerolineae bacterium]